MKKGVRIGIIVGVIVFSIVAIFLISFYLSYLNAYHVYLGRCHFPRINDWQNDSGWVRVTEGFDCREDGKYPVYVLEYCYELDSQEGILCNDFGEKVNETYSGEEKELICAYGPYAIFILENGTCNPDKMNKEQLRSTYN